MKSKIIFSILIFVIYSCENNYIQISYNKYTPEEYEMINQYLDLPESPLEYIDSFPVYAKENIFGVTFHNRNVTTLGRVLFYDKNLSKDKTVSCASCHKQEFAFSDNTSFSEGVFQRKTDRNSLALGARFSYSQSRYVPFFWDNRTSNMEEQIEMTFSDPQKMDMDIADLIDRVEEQPYYTPLFRAAYDEGLITEDNIVNAIATFINSIGSFNSKYDRAVDAYIEKYGSLNWFSRGELDDFTYEENLGRRLFVKNCSSCHDNSKNLSILAKRQKSNNGLDLVYEDKGIGWITGSVFEKGVFKVPTLRNIELTAPYMHDGRFETLEEVIEHYDGNIKPHPRLGGELPSPERGEQFNFTEIEKKAIVAFLKTYTDQDFLDAEKYSDPFR